MKNGFNYSQMLSGVVAASLVIGLVPLAHAQIPVVSKTKTTAAKSYNRALDADLIASVLNNDIKKVQKLLGRNADPNAKGTDYAFTPALCSAASGGFLEVARALVEAGATVEGGDLFGNVPLLVAALHDRAEVIRFLLQKGAKIEGERTDNLTALKTAATLGKNDALRALIAGGADINTQNGGSLSPLMAAALMGNVETVRALIAAKVNVHARLASRENALIYGAKYTGAGNLDIVKMLVEAGADVSVKNEAGKFAYQIAAENKSFELEKYLVDIYNRDSALFNVANKANSERQAATAITRLESWQKIKDGLAKGANPRFANAEGFTTLHNAIGLLSDLSATLDDNDATMKTLIARSDLNAQTTEFGLTVLHFAVEDDNARLVSALIKAGAYPNAVNTDKETPLDWALEDEHENVITVLVDAGAKTYAQLQNPNAATPSTPFAPATPSTPPKPVVVAPVVAAPPANTIAKSPLDEIIMEGYDQGVTLLMRASRADKVAEVERLLKAGATVDIVGPENGTTALFSAAYGNSLESIKLLLKAGANINFLDHDGEPPMAAASFRAAPDTIRALVEAGADLKYLDAAIAQAKRGNNTAVLEYLTALKTAPKTSATKAPQSTPAASKPGSTSYKSTTEDLALHYALTIIYYKRNVQQNVPDSDWSAVRKALAEGATARYADKAGATALMMIAVALPDATDEIERQILERADLNAQDEDGSTALHYAAKNGYNKMVEWLIAAKADIHILDNKKRTALDVASAWDQTVAAIALKNAEREQSTPAAPTAAKANAAATTALIKLLQQKTFDAKGAEDFYKSGADLSAFDTGGKTPLMRASEWGTVEAVKWLLAKKVAVDVAAKNGMTALMYGAGRANDDIAWNVVAALLEADAQAAMKNKDGKTAYDLAVEKHNDWTAAVLDIEMTT